MKKALSVAVVVGALLAFGTSAFAALDKDLATNLQVNGTFNDVIWFDNVTSAGSLDPITAGDVTNGFKKWDGIAHFNIDSAVTYMVAMDVRGTAPINYRVKADNSTGWIEPGAVDGIFTQEEANANFDLRLQARSQYIPAADRTLAASIYSTLPTASTQQIPAITGWSKEYTGKGQWDLSAFALPWNEGGSMSFRNMWTSAKPAISGPANGFVDVNGYKPVIAVAPSTNGTNGDDYRVDVALVMNEGDHVASGAYSVEINLLAMELLPGANLTPAAVLAQAE